MFKRLVVVVACVLVAGSVWAAPAKGELSFSAQAFKPKDGNSSYAFTGEYLIPFGHLYLGPSVSVFNGDTDGGAFGVAGEVHLGKKCGPGFGVAAYKPFGDAGDAADYTGEVRAMFECGSEHAFVKFTGRQVWSKAADGAVTDPDGTGVDGAIGWRF